VPLFMFLLYAPELDLALGHSARFLCTSDSRGNEVKANVLEMNRTGSSMIADRRTSGPSRPCGSAVLLVDTIPMPWSE
jgi:hypothetical protein